MLNFKSNIFLLLFSLLLGSCADVEEPEGGPKDEVTPRLIHSFPENGALNFKGNKVVLTFDKPITDDNFDENLVIMPSLAKAEHKKKAYRYRIGGTIGRNKLAIKFKVPLKENTTYILNVNGSIQDRKEKLKPTNAILTFSTGALLDAVTIKGRVKELLTNKPVEEVNIYLYHAERDPQEWQKEKGDSGYDKDKCIPDYYTTADKDGNFTIHHLRSGRYYIRAKTGKINDYNIDYEKNKYGFLKDPIDLTKSQEDIVVPLVAADVRDLKFLKGDPQRGLFEMTFNKPIKKYQLIPLQAIGSKGKPILYSLLVDKTIFLYNTFHLLEDEGFKINLIAEDEANIKIEKVLSASFKEGKPAIPKTGLSCSVPPRPLRSVLPTFQETIVFNKPIKEVKKDGIYFECKDQQRLIMDENALEWNADRTRVTIKKNFSSEDILQFITQEDPNQPKIVQPFVVLQLVAGSFIAFDHEKNKQVILKYPLRNQAETGTISGNIETAHAHFLIELLQATGEVVDTIRDTKVYSFTMVPPGSYSVRVRLLNEGEEEWFPGNIRKNIEPNPVLFYGQEIPLRAKWDVQGINFTF